MVVGGYIYGPRHALPNLLHSYLHARPLIIPSPRTHPLRFPPSLPSIPLLARAADAAPKHFPPLLHPPAALLSGLVPTCGRSVSEKRGIVWICEFES